MPIVFLGAVHIPVEHYQNHPMQQQTHSDSITAECDFHAIQYGRNL